MERDNFTATIQSFQRRPLFGPSRVAIVDGDRLEIDYGNMVVVREGIAVFIAPGGTPVSFDYEGVSQIIGDLAGRNEA